MRLIDADALLKKLDDSIWYNVADFNEAWYAVNHAPTVEDVTVRHGHWVYTPTSLFGFMCSECGKEMCHFNYCPYCGAKMDGRGNGNETD